MESMSRDYLRNIPVERHRQAVRDWAKMIRQECYNPAAAGKMRHTVTVKGVGCNSTGSYPAAPIVTSDDLVEELIRTMPGCRITYLPAERGDHGYNRPESILIDWS
jgi:hypothetical protein